MNILEPKHNLMLILLSGTTGDESSEEIYDRTRFAWKTNMNRASNVDYVIAHNSDEKILEIFQPKQWLKADDKEFECLNRGKFSDRVGFIGDVASEDIQEIYSNCLTPPRKKGAANPIRYLALSNEQINQDDSDLDDLKEESSDGSNLVKHTYLAGANTDDDSFDNIVEVAFEFVEIAFYEFSDRYPIYLIVSKKEDMNFLDDVNALKLVKLFEGCNFEEDEPPSKDLIRKILEDNSNSQIFDGGYWNLWFLFEFPQEDVDEFDEPGDNWKYTFLQLAKDFDSFTMIGYHSGLGENIWQQWCGTDYDEGAISNNNSDYYMGDNLKNNHNIDLKCLDIKNFEKI